MEEEIKLFKDSPGDMISITSYLYHDTLKDIIRRWMYGQVWPSDAAAIGRIINYNTVFLARCLPDFCSRLFALLHETPVYARPSRRKADLKDVLVSHCPYWNQRLEQMISQYRYEPGRFYRETPFNGTLYLLGAADDAMVVGSSRIKRVRRLAEKTARRIIDAVFASIKSRADLLAQDRADRIGVPRGALITPQDQMVAEFQKAESRLLDDLKMGRPILTNEKLVIQDVAGAKVIVPDEQRAALLAKIEHMEHCELVEVEEHRGNYNAVNLIVRYRPDREALVAKPPGARLFHVMQARGLRPEEIHADFQRFVLEAEAAVHIEVIVCNYQEMMESEIGRCMHEDRIQQQRTNQQYTGQLARNIEFLIAYLFAFASSSHTELNELPMRLWDRYLPDYFDEVFMGLYDVHRMGPLE
ncbi:MAG: hypothetical protein M0036_12130 [Desulfobacteraceae bacterium]|nr:hypothetical protein [Desulfobacteraceae bacterium]